MKTIKEDWDSSLSWFGRIVNNSIATKNDDILDDPIFSNGDGSGVAFEINLHYGEIRFSFFVCRKNLKIIISDMNTLQTVYTEKFVNEDLFFRTLRQIVDLFKNETEVEKILKRSKMIEKRFFKEGTSTVADMRPREIQVLFLNKPYTDRIRRNYDWDLMIPVIDRKGYIQDVMWEFAIEEGGKTELKKIPIDSLSYDDKTDTMMIM